MCKGTRNSLQRVKLQQQKKTRKGKNSLITVGQECNKKSRVLAVARDQWSPHLASKELVGFQVTARIVESQKSMNVSVSLLSSPEEGLKRVKTWMFIYLL